MTRSLLAVILAILVASCAPITEGVRVATGSAQKIPNAGVDPALIDEHCLFGFPEKEQTLDHGPMQLVGKAGCVLEHNGAAKNALWVCESLDPKYLSGPAERKDNLKPDPDLPPTHRAVDADYKGSGLQRGHMVASEDRVSTQALNDETFFFSNMVPLNGPEWRDVGATLEGRGEAVGQGHRGEREGDLWRVLLRSRRR
jgi:DNA/RNA endonuclease G (NUC1)